MADIFDQVASGQTVPQNGTQTAQPVQGQPKGDIFDQVSSGTNQPTATTQPNTNAPSSSDNIGQSWHDFTNNSPGSDSTDLPLTSYGAATRQGFNVIGDSALNLVKGAWGMVHPQPQTESEKTALATTGIGGMYVYRLMKGLGEQAESIHPSQIVGAIHDINNSKDPAGTYAKFAQKTFADLGVQGLALAASEGVANGATAAKAAVAPEGIVQQIIKGRDVAQPGAQAAIRDVVPTTEGQLVEGHNTILDKHLSTIAENEKAAYQKMDETAGFDVKAEKAQLANDQYKLKQLGNTDADVTQRGNLIESINDSEQRIADAETKMKAADIDPKAADAIHQQRMAGQDFKKSLVRNTNPADQSVNVQGLLKDAKNLRFNKYGDRLEQFFGSPEAADDYMSKLAEMDKLGAHAVKARWIAGITAGLLAGGGTTAKLAHVGAALFP
jgi:hypothetical protein